MWSFRQICEKAHWQLPQICGHCTKYVTSFHCVRSQDKKGFSKTQNWRQKFACKTQNRRQKWQPDHKYQATCYMTQQFLRIILQVGPFAKQAATATTSASRIILTTNSSEANYFRHATCSILHQIATANITVRSAPTSTIYPRPTRRSYLPCFLAALLNLQIISSRRCHALQLFYVATSKSLGRRIIGAR